MSIVSKIQDKIYRYVELTGQKPVSIILNPEEYSELLAYHPFPHIFPHTKITHVGGIPVYADHSSAPFPPYIPPSILPYTEKPSEGEKATATTLNSCVCGSKNPKGAGHSTWCDIFSAG